MELIRSFAKGSGSVLQKTCRLFDLTGAVTDADCAGGKSGQGIRELNLA